MRSRVAGALHLAECGSGWRLAPKVRFEEHGPTPGPGHLPTCAAGSFPTAVAAVLEKASIEEILTYTGRQPLRAAELGLHAQWSSSTVRLGPASADAASRARGSEGPGANGSGLVSDQEIDRRHLGRIVGGRRH